MLLIFTVHLKGDDAGFVDGAACNHDDVWEGQQYILCHHAPWIRAMAAGVAKGKNIGTIPCVNPLWAVV